MSKLSICIVFFIVGMTSCHFDYKKKCETSLLDKCFFVNKMESCLINKHKNVLCLKKYLGFWKTHSSYKGYSFCGLDSVEMLSVQKLIGRNNESLCITLDSLGISCISFIDNESKTGINHVDIEEINGLNNFLFFLLTKRSIKDSSELVSKLDSINKNYSNFYSQYTLFELFPCGDSIRKTNTAYQLWKDSNYLKQYIYTHELLKIFSYINEHTSNLNEYLKFVDTIDDLGCLTLGAEATTEFIFENVGQEPIILLDVNSSCGCIVTSYPKYPIKPGSTDKITIRYKGLSVGVKHKTITVMMYGGKPITLTIKANVLLTTKKMNVL